MNRTVSMILSIYFASKSKTLSFEVDKALMKQKLKHPGAVAVFRIEDAEMQWWMEGGVILPSDHSLAF